MEYRDFLKELSSRTLSCFENQLYPYETLVEELKVERNTNRNPLFDAMFTMNNFESGNVVVEGLRFERYGSSREVSKFDVLLSAHEDGDVIGLSFDYSSELFNRATIERFAGYFIRIVESVLSDPDVELSSIEMVQGAWSKGLLQPNLGVSG